MAAQITLAMVGGRRHCRHTPGLVKVISVTPDRLCPRRNGPIPSIGTWPRATQWRKCLYYLIRVQLPVGYLHNAFHIHTYWGGGGIHTQLLISDTSHWTDAQHDNI